MTPRVTDAGHLAQPLDPLEFRTERQDCAMRRGAITGAGFELRFPEPVAGPIALGFGVHFGLGQFAPARE